MSNSRKSNSGEQLVLVKTADLKERLNRVYQTPARKLDGKSFEHLWDLKELALLEGKSSVQVPKPWLEELDVVLEPTHTH